MAHDDMHVVMYKILAYLYDCMRRGVEPQASMIAHDGPMLGIPHEYWCCVMRQLESRGLVAGVAVTDMLDGSRRVALPRPEVTLEGVELLQENAMMKKALKFLREAKSALPFI